MGEKWLMNWQIQKKIAVYEGVFVSFVFSILKDTTLYCHVFCHGLKLKTETKYDEIQLAS